MNNECSLDMKKYLLTSVVVFVFILIYQLIVSQILGGSGLEEVGIFFYIGHLLFALLFTFLFSKTKSTGLICGVMYGVIVALLLLSANFVGLMTETLSLTVLIHILIGDVLKLGIAGGLAAKLYLE